jgi:hypothetical protein
MGMRMTQLIGLSERAKQFLIDHAKHDELCLMRNRKVENEWMDPRRVDGKYESIGMFGEKIPLTGYDMNNGSVVYEKEQASPWSSGPMIFTALTNGDGQWIDETKWTSKEIAQYIHGESDDSLDYEDEFYEGDECPVC